MWKFLGYEGLIAWLLKSRIGAHVIMDALYSRQGGRLRKVLDDYLERVREKVIVELHADGWVVVYGSKRVDAVIVQRPIAHADVSPQKEAFEADKLVEQQMPHAYLENYYPSASRTSGQFRPQTDRQLAAKMAEIDTDLAILKALDNLDEEWRKRQDQLA